MIQSTPVTAAVALAVLLTGPVGVGAVASAVGPTAPTPTPSATTTEWASPLRVTAGGEAIDVEVGHAAPWVADFDGDGLRDLFVGQFGNGKLRLYRNRGTAKAPEFSTFAWFQAGGADARVPAG